MNKLNALILSSCLWASSVLTAQEATPVPAQPSAPRPTPPVPLPGEPPQGYVAGWAVEIPAADRRTRFDLDFPGGTPRDLAKAIEAGRHKPLNLLVPEDAANIQIPAMKMTHVDLPELFQALSLSSIKTEYYPGGGLGPGARQRQSGFSIQAQGTITDDSVWCLIRQNVALPPVEEVRVCRFFNLAPYLDDPARNLKVMDITTAIETGWKMLGEKSTPQISFHKDTKLLIGVGESSKLEMIDMVRKNWGRGSN